MFRPALLLLIAIASIWPAANAQALSPYSAHSMVHSCCTPFAQKERMFAEAKAMGAGYIRLDVSLDDIFDVWTGEATEPRWEGVDEVVRLARRSGLRVLAVMNGTPAHISSCKERWPDGHGRCAPTDPERFGRYVAAVVAHAPDVFRTIEVWNEPDGAWAFEGTPEQYAAMLRATYTAVKQRFPAVTVVIGGAMGARSQGWYARALAAGGANSFDVANVHLRGRAVALPQIVRAWRRFFRRQGHRGPLWVTELGYPSATSAQTDAGYRGGELAQARYLSAALPALLRAGAAQVFVTLRDAWASEYGSASPFTSEGVLAMDEHEPYATRRKPAFEVVRRLAAGWARGQCAPSRVWPWSMPCSRSMRAPQR
jgi:hypothetical protein